MIDDRARSALGRWGRAVRALARSLSWKVWAVLGLAALALLASVFAGGAPPPPAPVAEAPPVDDGSCEQAASRIVFAAMEQEGLVRGEEVNADVGGLLIVVNTAKWNGMKLANQQRLMAAADCGVAGPGKHLSKIVVRGSRSGADLDVYDSGDLLRLREQGLARFSRTAP